MQCLVFIDDSLWTFFLNTNEAFDAFFLRIYYLSLQTFINNDSFSVAVLFSVQLFSEKMTETKNMLLNMTEILCKLNWTHLYWII